MSAVGHARRLVDEYLAESISVSKLPLPRLRDVPSARRLYAAAPPVRLAAAVECGRRLAWETSHAYVITSKRQDVIDQFFGRLSWTGLKLTASNWLTRLRQRLLEGKHGMGRMILNHHGRYERLFRLLLYRPPIASGRDLEALLAVVPEGEIRLFPFRTVYGAAVRYLRGAPTPRLGARLIRTHARLLDIDRGSAAGPAALAEAIRQRRGPERDFDDFRCDVDPTEVPEHLRHLAPLARTWGIGDDYQRNDLRRLSTEAALGSLVEGVRGRTTEIQAWLDQGGDVGDWSATRTAFLYLLTAYAEAGGTR